MFHQIQDLQLVIDKVPVFSDYVIHGLLAALGEASDEMIDHLKEKASEKKREGRLQMIGVHPEQIKSKLQTNVLALKTNVHDIFVFAMYGLLSKRTVLARISADQLESSLQAYNRLNNARIHALHQ